MKNFVLTEKGNVLNTNGGKSIIENGYVYMMNFSTLKMTKEKVIAESDSSDELELKAMELNLKGE